MTFTVETVRALRSRRVIPCSVGNTDLLLSLPGKGTRVLGLGEALARLAVQGCREEVEGPWAAFVGASRAVLWLELCGFMSVLEMEPP